MRKKRRVDAKENKRQAGGSEKDSRKVANIELEQGSSKDLNGTMFLVASAVTAWEKSFIFLESFLILSFI